MVENISQEKPIEAHRKQKMLLVMLILIGFLCVNLVSADTRYEWYLYGDDASYVDNTNWQAQTFTIGTLGTNESFNSSKIGLKLYRIGTPGIITVSIKAVNLTGQPTGADLTSGTTDGDTLTTNTNGELRNITMSSSYTARASVGKYAVVVRAAASQVRWKINGGGNYTGGWGSTSIDSGGGWASNEDYDFRFEIYGTAITEAAGEVSLISPANNALLPVIGANFTANYTVTSEFNVTNATYWVWNSTGIFNNSEIVIITGTSNSTTHDIDAFTLGDYEWNVWACWGNATFSNCSFAPSNYSFKYIGFSVTGESYVNQTIEGSLETFSINMTIASEHKISTATLNYDNTNYLGISNDLGNGAYEISRDLTIPSVSLEVNKTFYWILLFENGFLVNTTFHNQTVLNLSIDDCSIYTNLIYNFTIVDEEDQDSIPSNNSIEILVNIYSFDRSTLASNYSGSFNVSSIGLCVNRNLTNSTSTHLLDSTIKYSAQDHETEYYNIESYNLNDQSKVQNVTLYDLLTTDSTEFQLTFTDSDFLAVENALVFVKRQYVGENVFKTVELPKTDSNGQTILHLVRNDVVYNLEVMKDGVVIGNFENIVAFCEDVVIGDCKIVLSSAESGDAIFSYNDDIGITYTGPTYNNETRVITFNFLTTDSSVKTVSMNATRNDIFGNRSVCSAFVVSSGGTLTCEVPSYIDDSTIITKVFVNGKEILKDYTVLSEFDYGKAGYFIFFVYMLAFILMFSKSKTTMLIGIIVGFIVGIALNLISGRLAGIGASGIWLVIVVILMVWKLNKERPN